MLLVISRRDAAPYVLFVWTDVLTEGQRTVSDLNTVENLWEEMEKKASSHKANL